MISVRHYVLFTLLCLFALHLGAQSQSSNVFLQQQNQFKEVDGVFTDAQAFFTAEAKALGLEGSEMRLLRKSTGHNGFTHERYQQFYQDILVFGSSYILHKQEGRIQSASGYYLPQLNLDITPSVDAASAVRAAKMQMIEDYQSDKQQSLSYDAFHHHIHANLVIIDKAFPENSEVHLLAYRIELTSNQPYDKRQYFIDAKTGKSISYLPLLMHDAVPATAVTKYYGVQQIIVDSIGPNEFHLHDPTRGNDGISIWDDNLQIFTHEDTYWDITNDDQNEVALDAMYCTASFYDYMKQYHNWEGLDGEGESMNAVVNAGDFVNAFWNGNYATFGDGDCNRGPLTTMEVVAHEFTHGLTDYTSNLVYSDESGAINESMSDVFGKACEYYYDQANFNWWLGQSFTLTSYTEPFRSFENPNVFEHPKFYKGLYWVDGAGVHTNSSVGNHWFYNLIVGGAGVNENGEPYNITPLSWEDAMELVWAVQKDYLGPNSNYPFYYEASLLAAEEIFGAGSSKIESVVEAWKVVGLPYSTGTDDILDLGVGFTEFFVTTCIDGEFYEATVEVSNLGTVDYVPGMGAEVIINSFAQELTEPIAVGEKVTLTFDQAIFLDQQGFEFLDVVLDFDDANDANNDDFMFIENYTSAKNDLGIAAFMDVPDCINDTRQIIINVFNRSCDVTPAGTSFLININAAPNFTWSKAYELPTDIFTGGVFVITEDLDLSTIGPGQPLDVELVYTEDVFTSNNFTVANSAFIPTIDGPTTYDVGVDLSPFSQQNWNGNTVIANYQGDDMLRTTNFDFTDFITMCPEPEQNAQDFSKRVLTLEACLDLEGMDAPEMAFDIAQFRDDTFTAFPELIGQTSIVQAEWTTSSTETETYTVWDQNEGEVVNHVIPLPADYKGRLLFYFTNRKGSFDEDLVYDFDVNLFDDFQIYEGIVSTDDLPEDQPFIVFPNPSEGLFNVSFAGNAEQLQLVNMQGQLIQAWSWQDTQTVLDLSDFPKGMYVLRLMDGGEQIAVRKVVRL